MKKLISFTLAIVFTLTFSVFAFAYENTVDDSAMLFTQEEIDEIIDMASSYNASVGISLAIVTTEDAQGKTSEEFADDYHDDLIDNQGWSEDSMLFLIDMDNRNVWISTTGDAEFAYSDYAIDNIIDSGYDELAGGNYAQSILLMIDAAQNEYFYPDREEDFVEEHYYYFPEDVFEDEYYNSDDYYYYYYSGNRDFDITDILIYIVIGLVIAAITVFAVKSRYKNYGKGDEFDEDDITLNLTGSTDNVISRNVITTKIPRNNNHGRPGGGGFSGGSSHRSSGGRSHGGGGRSF